MNRIWKLAILAMAASTGCTTVSLTEYTINQNRTAGECRDRAVLDALAAVGRPVNVLEVKQQGQLVDDHRVRRPEGDRGHGVAPLPL